MKKFMVFGNPIAHSQSPFIHRAFAAQFDVEMSYEKQLVEIGHFAEAADAFREAGGCGINITVPFKHNAYEYVDQYTERAKRAQAVNTIKFLDHGRSMGGNTDGMGLVRDITENLGWLIAGRRVLIIGAGGAARGAIAPLVEAAALAVCIFNRTEIKAVELAKAFSDFQVVTAWQPQVDNHFDIIINATSASLHGEVPVLPEGLDFIHTDCYDMVYGADETAFCAYAREQGSLRCADGLGMLVEQAAESFDAWLGLRPETQSVIVSLRESLIPSSRT